MNKKGLTLVELISCISIISIVVILLFQLVITMQNNQNNKDDINKTNLTIAMIAREVQKDIESFGLAETPTTNCNLSTNGNDRNQILPTNVLNSSNPYYCIKITYNQEDVKNNEGYILYYQNKGKGFLAYKRGKNNVMEMQVVREISKLPTSNRDIIISKVVNSSSNVSSLKIDLPIGKSTDSYNLSIRYIDNQDLVETNEHFVTISGSEGITNITGNGKHKEGDTVNISFDYDTNAYTLENISCSSITCPTSSNFSFTMPNSNVSINITLKATESNVSDKLIDHIKNLDKTENGLQTDDYNNLRYVGSSPNNYIDFNGETWRIIGVFDEGVKIIREESIGNYAWNSANSNDWSTASLQTYLNGDYYNSLTPTAQTQIANETWNLGGWSSSLISAADMYTYERGTKVYSGRPTTWQGYIALMYPSDYGYASNTTACTSSLSYCNNTTAKANNWLYSGSAGWLLSPDSSGASGAFYVHSAGYVYPYDAVNILWAVRPTLYLKSDVKRTGGYGTTGSHFQISI